jgi:type III secretory pathway lipoprotein EscJ
MKTDQEKYNVIDILRRSGINASSGSRNSETDILVDKFDTDKAINILSAAGIKSSMG